MWQLRNNLDSNFCYNSKNENYFSIQTCSYYFHTKITEGVISSKTESVLTIETFNKQSHCSKLSIFLLLRNERNKDRNKQNLNQDLKEQFLCFPARKLAPHLFSVKDEERSERKTRPKQNCKSRVFGPWRGPFRVERESVFLRPAAHSSLSPLHPCLV
jgi:hypothetical protein